MTQHNFRKYQARTIQNREIVMVENWKVKVCTITSGTNFRSDNILDKAKQNLSQWLNLSQSLQLPTYNMAFLIVHEGTDGVWSIINWWIGGEMLQNRTYFTSFDNQDQFELCPNEGGMVCVWELAVIAHERQAWISHILKKATSPDFVAYLNDTIEGNI